MACRPVSLLGTSVLPKKVSPPVVPSKTKENCCELKLEGENLPKPSGLKRSVTCNQIMAIKRPVLRASSVQTTKLGNHIFHTCLYVYLYGQPAYQVA